MHNDGLVVSSQQGEHCSTIRSRSPRSVRGAKCSGRIKLPTGSFASPIHTGEEWVANFKPPAHKLTFIIVRVICVSRLVYRKGIDLLLGALPRICAMHDDVEFLIGTFGSIGLRT